LFSITSSAASSISSSSHLFFFLLRVIAGSAAYDFDADLFLAAKVGGIAGYPETRNTFLEDLIRLG
jgi:hypothetical protein